jgi:uncharacterized membrane protein
MTITESVQQRKLRSSSEYSKSVHTRWAWLWWIASLSVGCASNASSGSSSPDASTSNADSGATTNPDWCAVQPILGLKCQRCHSAPPVEGAPFSLLTYDDTQVRDSQGKARYERMASVIDSGYMPPQFIVLDPPVQPLTETERATLLAWCSLGAPPSGSASCAPNL